MSILIILYAVSLLLNIALAVVTVYNLLDTRQTMSQRMKQYERWYCVLDGRIRKLDQKYSGLLGRFNDDRK